MLRDLSWQATDTLTRSQWNLVRELADAASQCQEEQRRGLRLTASQWVAWTGFLVDGAPLPSEPPLPDMLHRLGRRAWALSDLLERHSMAAATGGEGQRPRL